MYLKFYFLDGDASLFILICVGRNIRMVWHSGARQKGRLNPTNSLKVVTCMLMASDGFRGTITQIGFLLVLSCFCLF